jgi:hypothetical protein
MGKPAPNHVSPLTLFLPSVREDDRKRRTGILGAIAVLLALATGAAFAQTKESQSLAERSSMIVRGEVLRTNASDERLLQPSDQTAVIAIEQMYAGHEIAGDQTGRTATVIFSAPGVLKPGDEAVFFGNPRFLGQTVTMVDEGEMPAAATAAIQSTLQKGMQSRRERLLRDHIDAARLIFRGRVTAVQPLEVALGASEAEDDAPTEHVPLWQVATVEIVNPLRGGVARQQVTVVFAASRDIAWFQSPKLIAGQDAVFVAHAPTSEEENGHQGAMLHELMQKQPVHMVTEPSHVLPPSEEDRVRGLMAAPKEMK